VAVLTPPGTGAIATIEVTGPQAWEFVRRRFRPAGKSLPDQPSPQRFWFGRLGTGVGDEVIVAVTATTPEVQIEVHCHGGRRVVRWVVDQFTALGCVEAEAELDDSNPWHLLTRAPTLRTAGILLDQAHGAFARAVRRILEQLASDTVAAGEALRELARLAPLGRHLVEPWKVVVAGPPNVGKSSLVNALAGFQRAIVSEIAGTTRDALTVQLAFDGWPVELTDTAGLRTAEGLEAEGIERAKRVLRAADLVVWVLDASRHELTFPDEPTAQLIAPSARLLLAINKSDRSVGWASGNPPGAIHLSAVTKACLGELMARIATSLVADPPSPGVAIPYTPRLAAHVSAAYDAHSQNRLPEAIRLVRDCLPAKPYNFQ
jgi:tRNA modification GTPase